MGEQVYEKNNVHNDDVQNFVNDTTVGVQSILQRAFIFLEDKDWDKASEYFERALDLAPTDAQAYLGKLLVDCRVTSKEELAQCDTEFDSNNNYLKVCRYGDKELVNLLQSYNESIKEKKALAKLEQTYSKAMELVSQSLGAKANKIGILEQALGLFEEIPDYKDSQTHIQSLKEEIEQQKELKTIKSKRNKKVALITTCAVIMAVGITLLITLFIIPNSKYNSAQQLADSGKYYDAINIYTELGDFKDSKAKVLETKYRQACAGLENGEYEMAASLFDGISDYKDSADKRLECFYQHANQCINNEDYSTAAEILSELTSYKNSKELIKECWLKLAQTEYDNKNYKDGLEWYKKIPSYDKKSTLFRNLVINYAKDLIDSYKFKTAVSELSAISDYKDAKELIKKAKYGYVKENKNNDDYTTFEYLKSLKKDNYKDSAKIYKQLYDWKMEVIAVNTNNNDTVTNMSSLSIYSPVYVHFKLTGGTPDDATYIYTEVTLPDGEVQPGASDFEMSDGDIKNFGWANRMFDRPQNAPTGQVSVVFKDENNNVIGRHYFTVTN